MITYLIIQNVEGSLVKLSRLSFMYKAMSS